MNRNSSDLYPLLFAPELKSYLWGGRNLSEILGRDLPPGIFAESWEIAAHIDGASRVINGRYAGQSLPQLHEKLGIQLIGRNNSWAQDRGKFPLLVKILDAAERLSVQVHPDDAYALAHEGNELGKTEMWVVLHARPGAEIILGVRDGTTPDLFRRGIAEGTLDRFLHKIQVKAGDHVCVPSGSVHAILDGLLIAEIQQNSNTTYRVFDWNRTENGIPRTLHVEKAMEVINFGMVEPGLPPVEVVSDNRGIRRSILCRNKYFTTETVELNAGAEFQHNLNGETFEIWGVMDGNVAINEVKLSAVEFTLLPAFLGRFIVSASQGATCLRVYVE